METNEERLEEKNKQFLSSENQLLALMATILLSTGFHTRVSAVAEAEKLYAIVLDRDSAYRAEELVVDGMVPQ
jgi:hypothetical protein